MRLRARVWTRSVIVDAPFEAEISVDVRPDAGAADVCRPALTPHPVRREGVLVPVGVDQGGKIEIYPGSKIGMIDVVD